GIAESCDNIILFSCGDLHRTNYTKRETIKQGITDRQRGPSVLLNIPAILSASRKFPTLYP
ncbi:MAG: hypothetical protein IKZ39_09235, partial [Lachnospiraceae bacterium]|nr:hypothetical protein [Lachnospiraceae bacterium]